MKNRKLLMVILLGTMLCNIMALVSASPNTTFDFESYDPESPMTWNMENPLWDQSRVCSNPDGEGFVGFTNDDVQGTVFSLFVTNTSFNISLSYKIQDATYASVDIVIGNLYNNGGMLLFNESTLTTYRISMYGSEDSLTDVIDTQYESDIVGEWINTTIIIDRNICDDITDGLIGIYGENGSEVTFSSDGVVFWDNINVDYETPEKDSDEEGIPSYAIYTPISAGALLFVGIVVRKRKKVPKTEEECNEVDGEWQNDQCIL